MYDILKYGGYSTGFCCVYSEESKKEMAEL